MRCADCQQLLNPAQCKTLQNGSVVCTACPDWRLECECRAVVAMPDIERKAHYIGVAKSRGEAAAKQLVADVNKYRRASKLRNGN